jgi:hypothetical protein
MEYLHIGRLAHCPLVRSGSDQLFGKAHSGIRKGAQWLRAGCGSAFSPCLERLPPGTDQVAEFATEPDR